MEQKSRLPKADPNRKRYSLQLKEYVEHTLSEQERNVYQAFFQELAESHNMTDAAELMMLDVAVHDFIRIKRLQSIVQADGETFMQTSYSGNDNQNQQTKKSVSEASHLLNSIETQFRQNMDKLSLTRKQIQKKKLNVDSQDFASFLADARVINAEAKKEERKDEKGEQP